MATKNTELNNYRILAFGGAGNSVANALLQSGFDQQKIFYFDTDTECLNTSSVVNKFKIGTFVAFGRSTKGELSIAAKAYFEDKDLFLRLIKQDLIYILVGGFGGGLFTGLINNLSEDLHKAGKRFIVIGTLPFSFEERQKTTAAVDVIKHLNEYTDKLILLKNDILHKAFGDLTVDETFRKIDYTIVEVIKEITFEIHSLEIINKTSIVLTPGLEDIILQVKDFIKKSEYPIATSSSKIIIPDTNHELLKALTIDPSYVYKISPRKFEELVAYIYDLSGHETKLTKQSRDDGADLLVWTAPPVLGDKFLTVVQAKRYNQSNKVGSKEIRELIGTSLFFKADKGQMVTTSDYSKPAIETAKANKIDLLKFYELNETIKDLLNDQEIATSPSISVNYDLKRGQQRSDRQTT